MGRFFGLAMFQRRKEPLCFPSKMNPPIQELCAYYNYIVQQNGYHFQ